MNRKSSICVLNSVHWYDAIFRTHGLSGRIADGMWTSLDRPPPYYSNAITVTASDSGTQVATLRGLGSVLDSPWSVKDSFRCLDLEPLGLRPLFDADWIWADAPAVADAGAWPGRVAADHDARRAGTLGSRVERERFTDGSPRLPARNCLVTRRSRCALRIRGT